MNQQVSEKILSCVLNAVTEMNLEQPNDQKIGATKESRLFGPGAPLDSIGLVSFVVLVEESVNQTFNTAIAIADEKAMSQKNSPFGSIGSLTDYVTKLVEEAKQ